MRHSVSTLAIAALAVCVLVPLLARPAEGLSDPNDFCTGNPCIISSNKSADPSITLDFGSRDVVLTAKLTLLNGPSGGPTYLTILAGSFAITSSGQIDGNGGAAGGGTVNIQTTNDIQLNGSGSTGTVKVVGGEGGSIFLTSSAGSISAAGKLNLNHDGINNSGGYLGVTAAGNINLSGNITATGGTYGDGGYADIYAGGDVVTGSIDIQGGEGGGGELDIEAGGSITLGDVNMDGGGDSGDGGAGDLFAGGDIIVAGQYRGRGSGNDMSCGDGSDLDLSAGGDVILNGEVDLHGRGFDCAGGTLTIDAITISLNGPTNLSGVGVEGEGGSLDTYADSLITVGGTIDVGGRLTGGGDVSLLSDGDVVVSGVIDAKGGTINSPGALFVDIDADGVLTMSGTIDGSGGAAAEGGDISLSACDVSIPSTGSIISTGSIGSIEILASDTLMLAGDFDVDATGTIVVAWGSRADPPNLAGAAFSVTPTLTLDATMVPCRLCDTAVECSDANPCTDDVCVPAAGCSNPPNSNSCSDGNSCTTGDVCSGGACVPGAPVVCDDGNDCTNDDCNPSTGCFTIPNSDPCDDGDACTTGDVCSGGSCSGALIDCDDGNDCTDDVCVAGACTNPNNSDPCEDGNECTTSDACSGGTCVGGPPKDCSDGDVCTNDSCDVLGGCQNDPIPGCVDTDGDGKVDSEDECTTIDWSASPIKPPDQNPLKFRLIFKRLSQPVGEQSLLVKGFFNTAAPPFAINPATHGMHLYIEDSGGVLYDVDIPGGLVGTGCDSKDGWKIAGNASAPVWKYRNRSGAFPPGCAPGSAKGITVAFLKDRRNANSASLALKIKAKHATLDGMATAPITRMQASIAMAAEPAVGEASPEAIAGQCTEALFTGNPVASRSPKPFCKVKSKGGVVDTISCKGR